MSPLDLMRAVRAARGLSPCEKAVLFCLSTYANADGGGCWPSIDTITDDTAWSRSKVAEARASLVSRGVLIRQGFTTSGTVCFAIAIPVVVALAEGLPVGPVPHELVVALVGDDVVDDGGCRYPALTLAHDAQGIVRVREECEAFTLPTSAVSARCSLGSVVQWG